MFQSINKPKNLRKTVYERIKKAIISHQLYPGMKLDEKELSERLGVSRTPVREAFARLDQEGLVLIEPNRGVFVSRITVQDLIEVLYMREVLEGLAARLFTDIADEEDIQGLKAIMEPFTEENLYKKIEEYNLANVDFHNYIIKGSKNTRLISTMFNLYDHLSMAKMLKVIPLTGRGLKSFVEHKRLIKAIEEGDPDKAEKILRDHVVSLREDIIENLDKIQEKNIHLKDPLI
jgi:DNA-binding GntR family transcriptional regulator